MAKLTVEKLNCFCIGCVPTSLMLETFILLYQAKEVATMAKLTVEKLNYPQVSCPHISMFVLRQQAIKITIDDFPSTQGCKNNRTGKPGFGYRGFKKHVDQRHEGEYVIPLEYLNHFSKLISESSPLIWIGMNHIILTPFQCSNVPRKVKGQNRYMPISPLQHLFCEVLDIQVHSHDPSALLSSKCTLMRLNALLWSKCTLTYSSALSLFECTLKHHRSALGCRVHQDACLECIRMHESTLELQECAQRSRVHWIIRVQQDT